MSQQMLEFVKSRLPMVIHDSTPVPGETDQERKLREKNRNYCIKQALFYKSIHYLPYKPLVSQGALSYVQSHWGEHVAKIWTATRDDIVSIERSVRLPTLKVTDSQLIQEHVTTGTMYQEMLLREIKGPSEGMATRITDWTIENYKTAWVLRSENALLSKSGFKCKRGPDLRSARAVYDSIGIVLLE